MYVNMRQQNKRNVIVMWVLLTICHPLGNTKKNHSESISLFDFGYYASAGIEHTARLT